MTVTEPLTLERIAEMEARCAAKHLPGARMTWDTDELSALLALARRALEQEQRRAEIDKRHDAMTSEQKQEIAKRLMRFAFSDDNGNPDVSLLEPPSVAASHKVTLVFESEDDKSAFIGELLDGWGESGPFNVDWDYGATLADGSCEVAAYEASELRVTMEEV